MNRRTHDAVVDVALAAAIVAAALTVIVGAFTAWLAW